MTRDGWTGAVLFLCVCAAVLVALSGLKRSSNCGGNSAALAGVGSFAFFAHTTAMETPDRTLSFRTVRPEEPWWLERAATREIAPGARLLVTSEPWIADPSLPRRIIAVCDTPFTNVPRRWFGSAPPTYAAGFSDGSADLISPEQFASLDRASFAYLDELRPAE